MTVLAGLENCLLSATTVAVNVPALSVLRSQDGVRGIRRDCSNEDEEQAARGTKNFFIPATRS